MLEIIEKIKILGREDQLRIASSILEFSNDFDDDLSQEEVEEMEKMEADYYKNGNFILADELLAKL